MDELKGAIERITYFNEENGYTVLKIIADGRYPDAEARDGTITVVGVMPELSDGESVKFSGSWIDDSKWGRQFRAEMTVPIPPVTEEGIERYLSSGIVKGIGPRTAEKIVEHFGLETLDILDNFPQRIYEVNQVKTNLLDDLLTYWQENQLMRQTIIWLQGFGISMRMSNRIFGEYGDMTRKIVESNPYQLADDVYGIGFKKADEIAQKMGMEPDARERLRAGLHYALHHLARDGHTYAPRELLLQTASELLEVNDPTRLSAILKAQITADKLKQSIITLQDGTQIEAIYLPMYYYAEIRVAENLKLMTGASSRIINKLKNVKWESFLKELAQQNDVELTPQQQSAVQAALTSKVTVLTGGPGTGKTTTLQMVIHALRDGDFRFALASPTGRAAKRLSEAANYGASTIHRLLGYAQDGSFEHDEDSPIEIDMLVVDEASMIDLLLFHSLLKALPATTHLMLVGDVDQLPSVGAGNVLRDIIDSGAAYVTRLDQIFRQSDESHIVLNAHRVNHGEMPYTQNKSSDFFFFGASGPEDAAELVVDIVTNRLPRKFDVDPMEDVQVIAPMYRGPVGVNTLNTSLQRALNSDRRLAEKTLFGRTFRVGDKVMQTKNNYEKDVFNGDIGRIYAIDFEDNSLEVVIDGNYIYYDWSDADQLIHAYCISTHRSQGSEYPVVVMPVMTQHYMMLQRNLLYTAITRARKIVVLVGDRRAIAIAVNNNKVAERYSGLLERLRV